MPSLLPSRRLRIASCSSSCSPSASRLSTVVRWLRIRMTTFSPSEAGRVETRRSTASPFTAHARAAVLRPEPVGDVEPGHDLDARDERKPGVPRDLHDLPQHAVDAVAHHDAAFDRLDVDVARPAGHAIGQHHVDQPDDRPLARLLGARGGLLLASLSSLTSKSPPMPSSRRLTTSRSGTSRRAAAGSSRASRAACGLHARWRRPASSRRRCRTGWRWRPRDRSRSGRRGPR